MGGRRIVPLLVPALWLLSCTDAGLYALDGRASGSADRASFEGDHELYFDDAGMLVQFSYSEFAGRLVITLKTEDAPLALAP